MPNWVDTTLEVFGSESEVRRFVAGIENKNIIKSYLPVPEELEITSTFAFQPTEIPTKWQEWVTDGTWTQEQYDERVRENNELAEAQKANIAKYGHKDWYDWQYQEWGTKWGDCHTDIHEVRIMDNGTGNVFITFDTPWGPAETAWGKISKMFPSLTFVFQYDEEAGFFAGNHVFRDGEIVFEGMYEPCSYEGDIDWSDDDSVEKYESWKNKNMDEIAMEMDDFLKGATA